MANQDTDHESTASAVEERLVPLIEQVVNPPYGPAGLGIGIVKDGEILLARGFGKRNLDTGETVTDRSLFHMASVSKTFVSTAIMQLWEQGRIDLDAPVTDYVPYFKLKGGDTRQITIRHMLSHTGGVPDPDEYDWHRPEYDDGALERYVHNLADEEIVAAPGQRFAYSNPAFDVLGDVIAKVSGQTFESYVKTHVLEPLGMNDSTFLRRDVSPKLATTPHFGSPLTTLPDAYPYNRAHAPCSTLESSAADMCRWMLAHLAYGSLDGSRILREDTYQTLWRSHAVTGEEIWTEESCLGWFRGTYRGRPVIHHGGSDPGFFSDLVLIPEMRLGVVVMSNAYCATAWAITDASLDVMLGLEPTAPKPPITIPVGAILASNGLDAAIAEYHRLKAESPDDYDFADTRFNHAVWGATELHRPEVAVPLLEVWRAVSPESARMFEDFGRAYLVAGDHASALSSLRRALELDSENERVTRLLKRLEGA